jgi:hypothetical protein
MDHADEADLDSVGDIAYHPNLGTVYGIGVITIDYPRGNTNSTASYGTAHANVANGTPWAI